LTERPGFEWYAPKAAANRGRHQVAFAEAATVFGDPPRDRRIHGERRRSRSVRRRHFVVLLVLALSGPAAAAAETPLVPILSIFQHWDHHWFLWLPGDPVHEAVEVASRERGAGQPPLIWVFFTERLAPKRQVHYINDRNVATATGWHFRNISFSVTGAEGGPRGVAVTLTDVHTRPIAIDLECAPGQPLVARGAGLTNQTGHARDQLFLVFFRSRNAVAQDWRVAVGGVDVARPQPGQSDGKPFAAYSANVFAGGFPFSDGLVAFGAPDDIAPNVVRFVPADPPGSFRATRRDGTAIELFARADGSLEFYRHRHDGHMLEIRFDPPLPPAARLTDRVSATYRITIDEFRDLISGTVHVTKLAGPVVLEWRADTPDWARGSPLRTTLLPQPGGVTRIELHLVR
jgi:hypothetical protein